MKQSILALDLSTARGSIAVVRDDRIIFQSSFLSERSHNAQVFAPLREALTAAGDDLAGIVIGSGPGSYTGVRISIAAAQGVALSRGVWCVAWSSLTAPDIEVPAVYRVVGDARRQSFYLARVENGHLMPDLELVSAEEAQQRITEGEWLTFDAKAPLATEACVRLTRPCAALLAQRVLSLSVEERNALTQRPLTPHYLADAFITMPKKKI